MELSERDERRRRILRERSEILARPLSSGERRADEIEVAVCVVGAEAVGFPVTYLREIVPLPVVTPLPPSRSWLLGVAQVRGTLLAVVDLALFLRVGGVSVPTHVAVIESPRGPIAFTVDRVMACRHVSPGTLETGAFERTERRAALGITSDLVVVLDVPRLLALPELVVE